MHVCRRWRYVVFGSRRRLDLRLLCINQRLGVTLDVWPELPIVIYVNNQPPSVTNLISVLNQHDRVCKISFDCVPISTLKEVATTMSEPFPALIELELSACGDLPDSFLGGSAPRLRSLILSEVSFPAIGKLLSSTRDLVRLSLNYIPPPGYISPKAMVLILSTLTRLESLHLNFEKSKFRTHGASQRPPAPTRIVLPALTSFNFCGNSRYLGDFVSRIDAPLDRFTVIFSNGMVVSDILLLRDFIDRTKIFNAPHRAKTSYSNNHCSISLFQRKGDVDFQVLCLRLEIPCSSFELGSHSQLSLLAQACGSLLPPLPSLEHLRVNEYKCDSFLRPWVYKDTTQWRAVLRPFIAVKDFVLDQQLVSYVAPTLQELVGEQGADILPALQNLFLVGYESSPGRVPEGILEFITARQFSGRPVKLHRVSKSFYIRREAGDGL